MSGTNVVTFDYFAWQQRYPELAAAVPQGQAAAYFAEATLYLDNTATSLVQDGSQGGQRALILNMVTAHIAALNMPGSSPLVGRIGSASEGSVSVSTTFEVPGTAAWFAQTKYGAAAWQALIAYRTMQYVPGLQPTFGPQPWPAPFGVQPYGLPGSGFCGFFPWQQ